MHTKKQNIWYYILNNGLQYRLIFTVDIICMYRKYLHYLVSHSQYTEILSTQYNIGFFYLLLTLQWYLNIYIYNSIIERQLVQIYV